MTNQPVKPTTADTEPEERDDAVIGAAFRWSLAVIVPVLALAGIAAWWLTRSPAAPPVQQSKLQLPTGRARPAVTIPEMPFTDITQAAGIDFVHENGAYGDKLLPETMGGGGAFLDYDNDGDQDLLLVNGRRWPWDERKAGPRATPALYRNDGTGHFENVTVGSGLDVPFYGMGVAVADYDADGHVDVFLSCVGPDRLFRNVGGRFEDVTPTAGVAGADDAWGTSCGWFDYDRDGDLDLFVCHYVVWSKEFDLAQNFQLVGGGRAYGRPQQFGGTFPSLYRNDGAGRFTDVSQEAGVQVRNPDTGVPTGKSLGLALADFDADGWLDVVVANDTVQNFLFHNRHDGTFEEIGIPAGIAYDPAGMARGAMGIDVGHFRNDDTLAVAIGNFANEMTALYLTRQGQLAFRDEAISTGLGPPTRLELTFGVFFLDADLDGRLDLFSANGHLEEDINKVQATQHYEQPPQLFWNCGPEHPTEFLPVPADKVGDDFKRPMVGRGAAYADIDADGDLDVLIVGCGQPPRLLRNDQHLGHHWLRLKLVGAAPNRDAIGATVELHAGGQVQQRMVNPTRSYLSQCELPVTFGLGRIDRIDKVVIRWPSGQTTELPNPDVDQTYEVNPETGAQPMARTNP